MHIPTRPKWQSSLINYGQGHNQWYLRQARQLLYLNFQILRYYPISIRGSDYAQRSALPHPKFFRGYAPYGNTLK